LKKAMLKTMTKKKVRTNKRMKSRKTKMKMRMPESLVFLRKSIRLMKLKN